MSKVLVYGFENGKLWVGRVTLWSWLMAGLETGRFVKVKPIKEKKVKVKKVKVKKEKEKKKDKDYLYHRCPHCNNIIKVSRKIKGEKLVMCMKCYNEISIKVK